MFDRASVRPVVPTQSWSGTTIPRIIHQTYAHKTLPKALSCNVQMLKDLNPTWSYKLYDDQDVLDFIYTEYGSNILSIYNKIDPSYGAARADLFRYLVIYKIGGVYLDIKSRFSRPIDEVIKCDEGFIISQWSNLKGERYEGYGLHSDVSDVPGGELQQWHVIAAPGHPFLKAVLDEVVTKLDAYRPWKNGVGKLVVLRTTGPIAYTRAIMPILKTYPCTILRNEHLISLDYSITPSAQHYNLFPKHYSQNRSSLVKQSGFRWFISIGWQVARALKAYFRQNRLSSS